MRSDVARGHTLGHKRAARHVGRARERALLAGHRGRLVANGSRSSSGELHAEQLVACRHINRSCHLVALGERALVLLTEPLRVEATQAGRGRRARGHAFLVASSSRQHAARALHERDNALVSAQLARRQVELGEAEALAYVVADVAAEEEREALGAEVAVAVVVADSGVYLRVGVQVADALYVDDDELVVRRLEREVAEGVRREAQVLVLVDEAGVRVVLDVLALDVVLEVEERRARSMHKLQYGHLKHVDLLGRIVAIVQLGPELGVHLQLDVVEVALAWHLFVSIALGHIVARVHPRVGVRELGQFFPFQSFKFD